MRRRRGAPGGGALTIAALGSALPERTAARPAGCWLEPRIRAWTGRRKSASIRRVRSLGVALHQGEARGDRRLAVTGVGAEEEIVRGPPVAGVLPPLGLQAEGGGGGAGSLSSFDGRTCPSRRMIGLRAVGIAARIGALKMDSMSARERSRAVEASATYTARVEQDQPITNPKMRSFSASGRPVRPSPDARRRPAGHLDRQIRFEVVRASSQDAARLRLLALLSTRLALHSFSLPRPPACFDPHDLAPWWC